MPEEKDRWDKCDVIGKIVSGVLLGVITAMLGIYTYNYRQSEDQKATEIRRAEFIEKMIDDLSQSTNKVKLDIALSVLDHSSEKKEENNKEKDKEYSALVTNIIKRVVLNMGEVDIEARKFALDILKERNLKAVNEVEDEIKKKLTEKPVDSQTQTNNRSSVDGGETQTATKEYEKETATVSEMKAETLQMKKTNVAPVIQQITAVFKTIIYIQIHDESEREVANRLRTELNKLENTIAPGVELVAGKYPNKVRYFNKEDEAAAAQIVQKVNAFFKDKGCAANFDAQQFTNFKAPKGQMEIWINFNCAIP